MKTTRCLLCAVLLALAASGAFAAGKLNLDVASRYTGGETVLMKITYTGDDGAPVVLDNPAKLAIEIKKPDGSLVASEARHRGWNKPGEYFDVYTIDYMGRYELKVSDPETGASATAAFDSVFATSSAWIVIILAVILIAASAVYLAVAARKKATA